MIKNRTISMIAAFLVAAIMVSVVVLAAPVEMGTPNTPGANEGVPGNRLTDTAYFIAPPSPAGTPYFSVADAGPVSLQVNGDGTPYQVCYEIAEANDVTGGNAADDVPDVVSNPQFPFYGNPTFMGGLTATSDVLYLAEKWSSGQSAGYFTRKSEIASVSDAAFGDLGAGQLYRIPDVSHSGTGAVADLTWTGIANTGNEDSLIGWMVYKSSSLTGNTNFGWGNSGEWQACANSATTAINNAGGPTYTGGESFYIPNAGAVGHSFNDASETSGTFYYSITAVFEGYVSSNPWNIESLYHGAASAGFTFVPPAAAGIMDFDFRATDGIQILQMPQILGAATTASDLVDWIETNASGVQVLYISDYDNGWKDFLHRSTTGAILDLGYDFTLDTDASYVISVRIVGADLTWEDVNNPWEEGSGANTVSMDAGWNNVGVFYDAAGNYDVPTDITDHANIDNAAAWVGNAWAVPGGSWADVQQQTSGGLSDTFTDEGNMHGFFVRAPTAFTWAQSS